MVRKWILTWNHPYALSYYVLAGTDKRKSSEHSQINPWADTREETSQQAEEKELKQATGKLKLSIHRSQQVTDLEWTKTLELLIQ